MILVRNIAFVLVLLMSLFVVIPLAEADIYRYVDASGRVHFTDTPTHGRYDMYMKENAPVKDSNRSYLDIIRRHATSYQREEAMVKAVIKVESA